MAGSPGAGDMRPAGPQPVLLQRHPLRLAAKEHREEGAARQERAEPDRAVQRDPAQGEQYQADRCGERLTHIFRGLATWWGVRVPDCLGVLP